MTFGHLHEIFSSFQGEGASIPGSCYGLRQVFVRFAGCPLALGAEGTKGCIWCDSPYSKLEEIKKCNVETAPGSRTFFETKNPLKATEVLAYINKLRTRDLHSISLTGGEPLHQEAFFSSIVKELKKNKYKIFLETAYTGSFPFLESIAPNIDFACVDLKDSSAKASTNWKSLLRREVDMCSILLRNQVKVFAKVVITKASKITDFDFIARLCGKEKIPLAIQIVTPDKKNRVQRPSWEQISQFSIIAAKYLPPSYIGISTQVHKLINIL